MLNSAYNCEGCVLTENIWIISDKWKWNFKCQCFRKLPQFAADSESGRMNILLSRRIVQKSRKKMWAVATSVRDMLGKNLVIEANLVISATKKEQAKLRLSCHPFPLHAGEHHGILFGELDLILSFSFCRWPPWCSRIRWTWSSPFSASRCLI